MNFKKQSRQFADHVAKRLNDKLGLNSQIDIEHDRHDQEDNIQYKLTLLSPTGVKLGWTTIWVIEDETPLVFGSTAGAYMGPDMSGILDDLKTELQDTYNKHF